MASPTCKNKKPTRVCFAPDERNIGGRAFLVDQHYNHLLSLQNMRSPLGAALSQSPPPQLAEKRNSVPIFKRIDEFHEIFETFKRVACVKNGFSDSLTPPKTFGLAHKQSKINNKFTRTQDYEHYLNVTSMARKIRDFGSLQDRRKNLYDHVAYPALFFRRVGALGDRFTPVNDFLRASKTKNGTSTSRRYSSSTVRSRRPQKTTQIDDEEVRKWQVIFELLPYVPEEALNAAGGGDDDNRDNAHALRENLAEQVAQLLVDQRLYKDEDFLNVNALMCQKNPHLDEDFIHEML